MISLHALLALAGVVALTGLGPMAYVLARQLRERRARAAAVARMSGVREVLTRGASAELDDTVQALAVYDAVTIDRTLEQLAAETAEPEKRDWLARLAVEVGLVKRYCARARSAHSWNERAHAVRVLGSLRVAAAVPALAAVLRDRYEDEVVRNHAADALGAVCDPAAIAPLIEELRTVDERATPRVAEALIRFGTAATPALIGLLADREHAAARVWAARVLAASRDATAVEALMASVRDRHDLLRAASAEALGAIADQRALPLLMQVALRDPAPLVRAQAASASARISSEEAGNVLIAALSDPDYATRLRALEAFESMRLSDTSALEKALADDNAEVRRRAALALERLGYLDRLVESLASDDRRTRAAAYSALIRLGQAGLVEGLAGRIRHESMLVRTAIVRACGELRAERAGTTLLAAVDDPAWPVRAAICEAIGRLRPKGGGRALIELLSDPEESVREAAASALAEYAGAEIDGAHETLRVVYENGSIPIRLAVMAIAANADVPLLKQTLIDATRDPSEAVRLRAVGALSAHPSPEAIQALIAALTDASVEVRMAAVPALGAAGTADSFEALLRTLSGAQPELRERIAEALSGVGRHHLLQSSEELARSDSLDVRLGVAWALGKIGDPIGVPVLARFLSDADPRLRASAAGALGKIPAAEGVAALVLAIEDPDPRTRAAVVNALGKCGAGHDGVQPALERRIYDPDRFVRNRAGIALARVAGAACAELARSSEIERLLDDPALVIMQGLAGTPETVALALKALGDPARLPSIQQFFDREEAATCSAFLASLKLRDPVSLGLNTRLDPLALAAQYERLLRSSQNTEERRAAVEALAGIRGDGQVALFAEALAADPDDGVRLRSAQVLARFEHEPARDALLRATGDPSPRVAVAALEGLRNRRDPRVARALLARLGAGSPLVNQAVEDALSELYRDDLTAFIDRAMGADRPAAMIAAIRVLELVGDEAALPLLGQLLKSQNDDLRAASVRALAKLGTAAAAQLIGGMLDDPQPAVRVAALEAIAVEGPNAVVRLASVRSDPSVEVRARLAALLAGHSGAAAAKVVDALLEDVSEKVRAAALLSVLGATDADGLKRFSRHFAQATPETTRELRSEPRVQDITKKLARIVAAGGDATTRELAVEAIAALAAEGHEQLLLPVLRDPRASVRLAAARALAPSRLPDVQRQVALLIEDPEFAIREAVREALARFGA